jgi:hypothetical protein
VENTTCNFIGNLQKTGKKFLTSSNNSYNCKVLQLGHFFTSNLLISIIKEFQLKNLARNENCESCPKGQSYKTDLLKLHQNWYRSKLLNKCWFTVWIWTSLGLEWMEVVWLPKSKILTKHIIIKWLFMVIYLISFWPLFFNFKTSLRSQNDTKKPPIFFWITKIKNFLYLLSSSYLCLFDLFLISLCWKIKVKKFVKRRI